MAAITEKAIEWTLADLAARFGPMPFRRIRQVPPPGTATEVDVEAIYAAEERLCELVDGILVEKAVGYPESYLAAWIIACLSNFVRPRRLGLVAGEAGMFRLNPGLVRIPDISFISAGRLPDRKIPHAAICPIVPDLAIEVLSPSNTNEEMEQKLDDYFAAGVHWSGMSIRRRRR